MTDPDGGVWTGLFSGGLAYFRNGSKLAVHNMIFDRDGNLWVATSGNGLFRIRGNLVDHFGRADGLAGDSVDALFEDREGILWAATAGEGIDKFRDPPIASFSTFEGLGNSLTAGSSGQQRRHNLGREPWLSRSHREEQGPSRPFAPEMVFRVIESPSMLEDRAGNMWVGVDDGLYLFKNGRFRPVPGPNREPLGLVVGLAEDVNGDVWAECFSNPPKLLRIRDFQVREEFPASRLPTGRILAPDPQGGIWIGTLKGDLALFRDGVLKDFPLNAKGYPVIRQIIANADGSVLAGSADGLVGLREGRVQRMDEERPAMQLRDLFH